MKLVLLGYFGFGNAGDEAVLAAEVAALRSVLGPETDFVVISGDPAHTQTVHGLQAVSRTSMPEILRAIRASDGLIAGGGSLLQDVTSARPVAFYGGVMLAARFARKPVFVYAQGLGPLRRAPNRWLAARALRRATYVALRDRDSATLAEALGVRDIDVVPDPVLGLDLGELGDFGEDEPASKPRLAVALRPWAGVDDWLPEITKALTALAADAELVFVPFHGGQDVELAESLAAVVGESAGVVYPDGGYRAALEAVAGSRAVFGMRLHALIAAAAANRPFVALSYDPKVTAFAQSVGQPIAATVPGPVVVRDVEALLRAALFEPTGGEYAGRLAVLRAEARRTATEIAARLPD